MNYFDAFVCPWSEDKLFAEKSARKTSEYLSFGKPILVSDVVGKESFMINEENCITYKPGNIEDLYTKLKSLFQTPSNIKKISENAQILSKKRDWFNLIEESRLVKI